MFHVKLDSFFKVEGVGHRERAQIERFADLLRTRAITMGLVAEGDRDRIEERHVLDSLRGLSCIGSGGGALIDMGSGAGLPGVPLAILRPDRPFALIDRRRKAVAFLDLVMEELALPNVQVIEADVGSLAVTADGCLARALAPADRAWRLAEKLLKPGGELVYWAGREWEGGPGITAGGTSWEICRPSLFSWQGPLVIMKRPDSAPVKEPRHEA